MGTSVVVYFQNRIIFCCALKTTYIFSCSLFVLGDLLFVEKYSFMKKS